MDLEAAAARGIVVTNTPGANAASVAELTVAFLLLLARPVMPAAAATRAGEWPRTSGLSLAGKTVGLVGLGAIGREVARRLAGFNCRVLSYDVAPDTAFAREHGVTIVTLEQLLAQSDFVSLHAPLLPSTRNMVDAAFLAAMKPGARLINTARGELVDEAALLDALQSGHLAGAALDAFAQEPPGGDNPLLALLQVVATPHMGAHTDGSTTTMGALALPIVWPCWRAGRPAIASSNIERTMDKRATLQQLKELGLIAVIRGPSADKTVEIVAALAAGGVRAIEITYSTPQAADVVRRLSEQYGDEILLGMGTLTCPEQAEEAAGAGAHYLVSPMIDEALAGAMVATGRVVMIGALTPTEIVRAHRLGSDVVKLFPGSLGGPAYLKAIRGPFPDIPIMPTGGVEAGNLADWFAAGAFAVGAGSNLCPKPLVQAGHWDEITELARAFVAAVSAARS